MDLFGAAASGRGAVLHTKAAPDELTSALSPAGQLEVMRHTADRHAVLALISPRSPDTFIVLRI
jgi:hypothetical protein